MTAPTDAERALEIVADHRAWLGDCLCGTQAHEGCAGLAARIAAALAEERERAARIAETFVDACDVRTAREIAAEIRAGEKR